MRRRTLAALAAGALGAAALAGAAASKDDPFGHRPHGRWSNLSPADREAFAEARIAALHAGLRLNADQEKNWPAVETALRDLAKERASRMNARAERRAGHDTNAQAQPAPDAIARMREGADALTARAAGLKKLADASEPLYKSLDDGQKRRFSELIRMGGRAGMEHHRWRHRG